MWYRSKFLIRRQKFLRRLGCRISWRFRICQWLGHRGSNSRLMRPNKVIIGVGNNINFMTNMHDMHINRLQIWFWIQWNKNFWNLTNTPTQNIKNSDLWVPISEQLLNESYIWLTCIIHPNYCFFERNKSYLWITENFVTDDSYSWVIWADKRRLNLSIDFEQCNRLRNF